MSFEPIRRTHNKQGFTHIENSCAIWILIIVVAIVWSTFLAVSEHKKESNRLYLTREVYRALVAYAEDHNNALPWLSPTGAKPTSSNDVFRNLIPKYFRPERNFFNSSSAWTPTDPDEVIGNGHTLAAGENSYAYVSGLTLSSKQALPIIADGFAEGKPGSYLLTPKKKGFAGNLRRALIVRLDGSGSLEEVNKSDGRVYGLRGDLPKGDLFENAPGWLQPWQPVLNPE